MRFSLNKIVINIINGLIFVVMNCMYGTIVMNTRLVFAERNF